MLFCISLINNFWNTILLIHWIKCSVTKNSKILCFYIVQANIKVCDVVVSQSAKSHLYDEHQFCFVTKGSCIRSRKQQFNSNACPFNVVFVTFDCKEYSYVRVCFDSSSTAGQIGCDPQAIQYNYELTTLSLYSKN